MVKLPPQAPRLINFDFMDELSGNSYIRFFPTLGNTGSQIFYLSRKTLDSQRGKLSVVGTDTEAFDFDTTFDVAAIIKGDAYFNYTTTSGSGSSITVTMIIKHVAPDTTETTLGTASSPGRGSSLTSRENLKITLLEMSFAVGDTLRITISVAHAGANSSEVWCDPTSGLTKTDNFGRTVGTDIIAEIPFKNTN